MTVFLTGSSGHVGANLLRTLTGRGEKVRVLVQPGTDPKCFEGLEIERIEGDLRDAASVYAAMRDVETAYHVGAKVQTTQGHEQDLYETNVLGTRHVLAAARAHGVRRVVVTSSLGAVGQPEDRPCTEEDGFNPFEHHLPYEESKAWVEHECLRAACEGLPVVIVVSTAVLGPNDFGPSRMGRVIKDFANRQLSAYIPGGFEFVRAADLVSGHLLAMEKGVPGQRYIVSTRYLSVDELMGMLEELTGVPRPRLRLSPAMMSAVAHVSTFVLRHLAPDKPLRFTPDAVRLLTMQRRADIGKARRELGYEPTSLEDAVREAYEWFVASGQILPDTTRPNRTLASPSSSTASSRSSATS